MTLLMADDMDRYESASDFSSIAGQWASNPSLYQASSGAFGGGCSQHGGVSNSIIKTFQTAGSIPAGAGVHSGFYVRRSALNGGTFVAWGTDVIAAPGFVSGSGPVIGTNVDGSVYTLGHNMGLLQTSALGVFEINKWYWCEYAAKWNTSGNGGFVKVWLFDLALRRGGLIIDFTGTTQSGTVPSTFTQGRIGTAGGGGLTLFDDCLCWDEVGTDFAFSQLSQLYLPRIFTKSPNNDRSPQFTPSPDSGANFEAVDDPAFQDADTTYNASTVAGNTDEFDLENLTTSPAKIFGAYQATVARIDAPGTVNLRTAIRSGATLSESADRLLALTNTKYWDFFGKNPDGNIDWTGTAIDQLISRYKHQSG